MASRVTGSRSNRETWVCGSNRMMLSCHYRPKSARDVSSTLLNQCHKNEDKVPLIKWLGCSQSVSNHEVILRSLNSWPQNPDLHCYKCSVSALLLCFFTFRMYVACECDYANMVIWLLFKSFVCKGQEAVSKIKLLASARDELESMASMT